MSVFVVNSLHPAVKVSNVLMVRPLCRGCAISSTHFDFDNICEKSA